MTHKKDELMFFQDYQQDPPQPDKQPDPNPASKKTESRPISKNLLMEGDDDDYENIYNPPARKKTNEPIVHEEKKQIIWQPGNSRKYRTKLPELSKHNVENKKQINIDSSARRVKKEAPKEQDGEQSPTNGQRGTVNNATPPAIKEIQKKEDDRKRNHSDDDVQDIALQPKVSPKIKSKNILEQQQQIQKPKPIQKPKSRKVPKFNSDSEEHNAHESDGSSIKGNSSSSQPIEIKLESEIIRQVSISDISNRKEFLLTPIAEGRQLQCTIKRQKGSLGLFSQYDMFLSSEYRYLMSAKKRPGNATSNYLITADKNDMEASGPNYLGKVRSNFMGTNFQIYDDGCNPDKVEAGKRPRKILASVHYASNIFGSKGPRKMQVYVPNPQKNPTTVLQKDLKEHWQKDPTKFVELLNKPPKWNEQKQIYMLDFKGRVDKPSVKNFILTHKDQQEPLILLFGRVGEEVFHLDITYPLSPLQALGIVMTSFDTKLACQ